MYKKNIKNCIKDLFLWQKSNLKQIFKEQVFLTEWSVLMGTVEMGFFALKLNMDVKLVQNCLATS